MLNLSAKSCFPCRTDMTSCILDTMNNERQAISSENSAFSHVMMRSKVKMITVFTDLRLISGGVRQDYVDFLKWNSLFLISELSA